MANISREDVLNLIRHELDEAGVEDDITPDTQFSDLDMDSLDAAELVGRIEDEFGVEILRQDLSGQTVDGIVSRVVDAQG